MFFTISVSLKKWQAIGNLGREIKPYNFLANQFKKIYFITYGGKEDWEFKKFLARNIEILPKKWTFLPSVVYGLLIPFVYKKELQEADIYKTNQMAASVPALLAKWFYQKKLIIRCGYEWLSFLERRKELVKRIQRTLIYFLEKIAYKAADKVILATESDKNFVLSKFKTTPSKIEIIPNYVDTELFAPLNIAKEKNRICFIGTLFYRKNPLNLLRAVDNLEVKLIFFGRDTTGGKIKLAAKKIRKAKIEFRGNIPNESLPEELRKSELFILPSFYEGNPKVLLEAMSCGLPCIGTDVEGIKEIIKHKENGYLCNTDVSSIRRAILEVLENKELQKKIGKNARQTIVDNFAFSKSLAKEKKIYETL